MHSLQVLLEQHLATPVSMEAREEPLGMFDLIEMASMEASLKDDLNQLDQAVRMVRELDRVSISEMSVESYQHSMASIFGSFNVIDASVGVVPSMESHYEEGEYSAEAEAQKQGFAAKIWAVIKRLWSALVEKAKALFGRKKNLADNLMKQQEVAEKQAAEFDNDFSKMHPEKKADEVKPDAPAAPVALRLGYAEGQHIKLGFTGHTIAEVVHGCDTLAKFANRYINEIEQAAELVIKLDYTTIQDLNRDISSRVSKFAETLKLPCGTEIDAQFNFRGPKVDVWPGKDVSFEVRNLHEVPVKELLHARRALIEVLGNDYKQLKRFQSVIDGMMPTWTKVYDKYDALVQTHKTPEWEANKEAHHKQHNEMRGLEVMLGFLQGVVYGRVEEMVQPAIIELSRCLGMRNA